MSNYMMFLLQQKNFDQFNKVLPHAKRIMDKVEIDVIIKMHNEFKLAIDGTEGQILPEDDRSSAGSRQVGFSGDSKKPVSYTHLTLPTKA